MLGIELNSVLYPGLSPSRTGLRRCLRRPVALDTHLASPRRAASA
jgi:hypothetical protein